MVTRRKLRRLRKGNVLVMAAFMMVLMIAFVAFAVDVGYLYTCKNELQRTADSAAIAAAWELMNEDGPAGYTNVSLMSANAHETAEEFAALNPVGTDVPALGDGDVEIGYMVDPSDPNGVMVPAVGAVAPNAVQVRVQRTELQNGEVPLFFARVLGYDSAAAEAEATAALLANFGGFKAPSDGTNLEMLPFALDEDTWNGMLAGGGTDEFKYDSATKTITPGIDGIREINLYPQGTGAPGNRGTVDIGGANNSTNDLKRQIESGVSPEDFEALYDDGRTLELNDDGELFLNGDPGISAGMKDSLVSIKGKPKMIPIFRSVSGNGNNAEYTIVSFVGVRVLDVKLTGSMTSKKVIIQPANIITKGGVPASGGQSSYFIYSPVWLVR